MYSVFTKLGDGDFLFIVSFEKLKEAAQLVEKFNTNFPLEYVVRDSKGNDVSLQK
jgi:hypothetical protein